jgi:protein gp37
MNKTRIEWADFTWNPVTGCLGPKGDGVRCPYCYANRLANGRLKNLYLSHRFQLAGVIRDPFAPRFWRNRLDEPRHLRCPSKIFVCSQGELFGPWIPHVTIELVLNVVRECPQHIFMFLTKWPQNLARWNPWPSNCWVGASAENQPMAVDAASYLTEVAAPVKFLSLEPLLGRVDPTPIIGLGWLIIGAQTGPGARPPESWWVSNLLKYAYTYRVPVFLKDNLRWPEKHQKWPASRSGERTT